MPYLVYLGDISGDIVFRVHAKDHLPTGKVYIKRERGG
jgi:hypothetical protein